MHSIGQSISLLTRVSEKQAYLAVRYMGADSAGYSAVLTCIEHTAATDKVQPKVVTGASHIRLICKNRPYGWRQT